MASRGHCAANNGNNGTLDMDFAGADPQQQQLQHAYQLQQHAGQHQHQSSCGSLDLDHGDAQMETQIHRIPPGGSAAAANQSSFKRSAGGSVPVMGHRGLETRNSKRAQQPIPPPAPVPAAAAAAPFGAMPPPMPPPAPSNVPPSAAITVGALEVQNVKRAINRYGTLPKGARIGAYLESLRQTDGKDAAAGPPAVATPANNGAFSTPSNSIVNSAQSPAAHRFVSNSGGSVVQASIGAAALKCSPPLPQQQQQQQLTPQQLLTAQQQPQMIRSNSSGGVTMANSASASLSKLQRHRTTTDGTMMMSTFSSFRSASAAAAASALPNGTSTSTNGSSSHSPKRCGTVDLEFPPPPLDLPPPAEEETDLLLPPPLHVLRASVDSIAPPPPPQQAPNNVMLTSTVALLAPSNDVSNTAPSVEEASSRFGVSLRKREPSTDSCSSMGSPMSGDPTTTAAAAAAHFEPSAPRSKYACGLIGQSAATATAMRSHSDVGLPTSSRHAVAVDPAAQLVSELADAMNLPGAGSSSKLCGGVSTLPPKPSAATGDRDHDARPTSNGNAAATTTTSSSTPSSSSGGGNTFKAQLKRVDPKKMPAAQPKDEPNATSHIIDYKARLRKVENNNDATAAAVVVESAAPTPPPLPVGVDDAAAGADENARPPAQKNARSNGTDASTPMFYTLGRSSGSKVIELNKTEPKVVVVEAPAAAAAAAAATANEDDEKRKSTGSISSLKKLWEAKEGAAAAASATSAEQQQLSPKMALRNLASNQNSNNSRPQQHSDDDNDTDAAVAVANVAANASSARKPVVPVKPSKLVSIYATPIQVKLQPAPSTTATAAAAATDASTPTLPAAQQPIDRLGILELVARLQEGVLQLQQPHAPAIAGSQWLQLSDKLNALQHSCVAFADRDTMAPHSKFQFREVVTRIESQSLALRSAGAKTVPDNERLVQEVGQSLKQISNALHR